MATNFPNFLDVFTDKTDDVDDIIAKHINDMQDAVVAIETKIGIGTYVANISELVNNFITSGRAIFVYTSTAATGWTIVSASDRVLATSGGSGAYNVSGGTLSTSHSTWSTIGAHTHTLNTHDHTISAHTHQWYNSTTTTDQVGASGGSFTNILSGHNKNSGYSCLRGMNGDDQGQKSPQHYSGPADCYVESLTEDLDTVNSASGAASYSDARPQACVGIIVSRDAP